jgi:hypothetical protein
MAKGRQSSRRCSNRAALAAQGQIAMQYVDIHHQVAARYPFNPNGSVDGITGLTSADGRALIMMPHPERVYRAVSNSWRPDDWGDDGPWLRLFRNAGKALRYWAEWLLSGDWAVPEWRQVRTSGQRFTMMSPVCTGKWLRAVLEVVPAVCRRWP